MKFIFSIYFNSNSDEDNFFLKLFDISFILKGIGNSLQQVLWFIFIHFKISAKILPLIMNKYEQNIS
jgi:hypothetical protein